MVMKTFHGEALLPNSQYMQFCYPTLPDDADEQSVVETIETRFFPGCTVLWIQEGKPPPLPAETKQFLEQQKSNVFSTDTCLRLW